MKIRWFFTATLFTFFFFASARMAVTQNPPPSFDADWQLWTDVTANIPLDKKKMWMFGIGGVWRLGNDLQTSVDERVAITLMRKLNKHFSVGAGYVYRASNPSFRLRRYESRYQAIAVVTIPLPAKLTLISRNIMLHQSLYSRPDTNIFRTRQWIKRPVKIGSRTVEPFAASEEFWNTRLDRWTKHRFQTGISTNLGTHVMTDVYFVYERDTTSVLPSSRAKGIGASLRVNL